MTSEKRGSEATKLAPPQPNQSRGFFILSESNNRQPMLLREWTFSQLPAGFDWGGFHQNYFIPIVFSFLGIC